MKPIYILGLKRILYFGLPFATIMTLVKFLTDEYWDWRGFCFLFMGYGIFMSFIATITQKKFLTGIGIPDPKADDLDLIHKKIILSPLDPETIKSIILKDFRYQLEDQSGEGDVWYFKRLESFNLLGERLIVRIKDQQNGLHEIELVSKRILKLGMDVYGRYPRHLDLLEKQIRLAALSPRL